MGKLKDRYGDTALVAGSSEGLGAAFCHALASEGINLIMIARRKEQLEAEAETIRSKYGVKVTVVPADLADPEIVKIILAHIGDVEVDIMVYNAAIAYIGPYLDAPIEKHMQIATVNMQGPLRLTHHFGQGMVARQRGAVILMSSIAGMQGAGFLTTYSSTKAFNRQLAESLWYEWKDKGVDVLGCCAGSTATPGFIGTKPEKISPLAPAVQSPEAVVAECFDKLGKVPSFISGTGNKVATFFMKVMPRKMAITIMGDTTREMYRINY